MSTERDREDHIQAELGQALRDLGLDTAPPPPPAERPASDLLPRGAALGRFVVLEPIGRGGQGDVYTVYDPELDRRVALKRIRGGHAAVAHVQRTRLMREAQALARLQHPNVLRVHEVGTHDDVPFIVTEYKTHQTLTHWLATGRQTWRDILGKFLAAGRGLSAAHAANILHRDIKADNIFIDDHVGAVLGDFGLAFGLEAGPSPGSSAAALPTRPALGVPVTDSGVPGTVGYIAPEAMAGHATHASDQYSFCVALFHALFGVLARPDERRTPSRPGDEPPPRLLRVLHRGLSRDPAARYPDMDALLAALDIRPRRRAVAAGLAGFALALLAGFAWAWASAEDHCRVAARAAAEAVWSPGRRAALARAFAAVDLPYARRTGETFVRLADEYRARWIEARAALCAAPSPAAELCLAHQLERFDGLIAGYAAPAPSQVAHALDAAAHLDLPVRCREAPASPSTATPQALRHALDRAELRIAGGDLAGAHEDLDVLRRTTHAGTPAGIRLLWLTAWLAGETSPDRRAHALLDDAIHAAARALDHDTFARAAAYRLKSLARDLGEPAEAAALERWVETLAAQWPRGTVLDRRLRAELAEARGIRLDPAGEAADSHRRGLELREQLDGRDHPRLAKSHHNLAISLSATADAYDEARAHFREALRIRREQLGESHPATLETLFGMAQSECEHLDRHAPGDPAILTDCVDDLAANLAEYRRQPALDPRGAHRRAVALANHAINADRIAAAEAVLTAAERGLAGLADVDVRERSDALAVRGKLAAWYEVPAAFTAYTAGVALWRSAGRFEEAYFQHLDSAVRVAVGLQHADDAAALLLAQSAALAGAACPTRARHADMLTDLAAVVGPVRGLAEAVAAVRRDCP